MESWGPLNYHNGLLTVMKGFFCGTASGADSEEDVKCESLCTTHPFFYPLCDKAEK